MRSSWGELLSCLSVRAGVGLVALAGAAVLLVSSDPGVVGAEEYSAYSDPGKTALSFILSQDENARAFQEEFGLDDQEMDQALAAVREENQKVAGEYAESEEIVASSRSLPDGKIAGKISASDYDEAVQGAIGETKESVAALLPEDGEQRLKAWVDEQWRQEVQASSGENAARMADGKAGGGLVCKVWATQYIGYTRYEAALPHRTLKFGSRPKVPISRNGRLIQPRIKEVGPWNTYDNYWQTRKNRSMWKNLPRCRPEAQAAFYSNYNRGRDEFGRKVLNPAGVDLTPAAARGLGFQKYASGWVYVRFPWVR